jgi:UDP-glucuronate 4-epimerase
VKDNLVAFSNIASQSCIAKVDSFLYASSSSVYGNNSSTSLSENINGIKPISFYGATKLANEILANSLAVSSATKFRGLRFFTVYGPWGRPDMAYLKIINAALNKKSFELFGDGSKIRDFTYVDDVVSSVVSLGSELLSRKSGFSDVVNVGGGQPISMNNLIDTIQKELNVEIEVKRGQDASGDVFATNANTEYLKSLIPSENFVNIQEGIKQVVKWAVTCNDQNQFENWVS